MLLWLAFGLYNHWGHHVVVIGDGLLFVLFALLGWKVFGKPIDP